MFSLQSIKTSQVVNIPGWCGDVVEVELKRLYPRSGGCRGYSQSFDEDREKTLLQRRLSRRR